jgi:hypothetical protein
MAAPSLQDVLASVPSVSDMIDSMTELSPGIPANSTNLKELLEYLTEHRAWSNHRCSNTPQSTGDDPYLVFRAERKKITATLLGKPEAYGGQHGYHPRPEMAANTFVLNEEGLMRAISWGKRALRKARDGPCTGCAVDASATTAPRKRLKANNMPQCHSCVLATAVAIE